MDCLEIQKIILAIRFKKRVKNKAENRYNDRFHIKRENKHGARKYRKRRSTELRTYKEIHSRKILMEELHFTSGIFFLTDGVNDEQKKAILLSAGGNELFTSCKNVAQG